MTFNLIIELVNDYVGRVVELSWLDDTTDHTQTGTLQPLQCNGITLNNASDYWTNELELTVE